MEKNLNQYSMSENTTDTTKPERHYVYAETPPTNDGIIVFFFLYLFVCFVIMALIYKFGKIKFPFTSKENVKAEILFFTACTTFFIIFCLCVFYSPWNEGLKKVIDDAKKKEKPSPAPAAPDAPDAPVATAVPVPAAPVTYVSKPKKWTNTAKTQSTLIRNAEQLFTDKPWEDKLKNYDTVIQDTEALPKEPTVEVWNNSIKKYKRDDAYDKQTRNIWKDALDKQNRYYLLGFMFLSLLPFFWFLIYIQYHTVPEINVFINGSFSFLMLTISVFYTAILLLLYTVTKKTLATMIPILMFFFLGGLLYFQKFLPFLTSLGILAICIIESFLIFYHVAFVWCLIPLVPLFLILFTLYTQQQR